jgi:hypothetical protein
VEQFADLVGKRGRMALFRKKTPFDHTRCAAAQLRYVRDFR